MHTRIPLVAIVIAVSLSFGCIAEEFASESETTDAGDNDAGQDADAGEHELVGQAIFVSLEHGDESRNGLSPSRAVETIGKGIRLAAERETEEGETYDVAVAAGTYEESVELEPGVNIYGGFSDEDWSRDLESDEEEYRTEIRLPDDEAAEHARTVVASELDADTVLSGLHIVGYDFDPTEVGEWPGASSYALWVEESQESLRVEDSVVIAGDGAAGNDGDGGEPGEPGDSCADAHGGAGERSPSEENRCEETDAEQAPSGDSGEPIDAGGNGDTGGSGGSGGVHFCISESAPNDTCEDTDIDAESGTEGSEGNQGEDAEPAQAGTGSFADGAWRAAQPLQSATAGERGTGGGAGGAGGNCANDDTSWVVISEEFNHHGGTGGAGGAGGCPGEPGTNGEPGGGSFSIFLVDSHLATTNVELQFGNGGRGGDGGTGGRGGDGADGDDGGEGKNAPGGDASSRGGTGGDGGDGGDGGRGGHGAGACGGPSVGVATANTATVDGFENDDFKRNDAEAGPGGAGGGNDDGLAGCDGVEEDTLDLDE